MNDTICAIATAPGGAIGIVRLSGPEAISIASRVCHRIKVTTPSRTAVFTPITLPEVSPDGLSEVLDEALVTLFRAPNSYTGEDCVEFSCHGSRYILNQLIELLISSGARLANPGEFTQRAFLNGKLDLSQAEAIAELIASTNRVTHHLAMSQLRGHVSNELASLRDQLLRLTSLLELELDFSDHEELEFADRSELLALAQTIDERIQRLTRSFETGQAIKEGIPVAIVGKTNVGKSTLLNRLLRDDRAIVSDIHGTTRDTIEDTIDLRGITFRFIDTAGIRQTADTVEKIGISRTYAAIVKARIVLWLIDEPPVEEEIADIQARCEGKKLLVIQNKIDINENRNPQSSFLNYQLLGISAKTGQGIPALEDAIFAAADVPELTEQDVIITSARHFEALTRAHDSLTRVIDGLGEHSLLPTDLIAEDLRLTLASLADITGGAITPQETLNNIFSHFCVGK